MSQLSGINNLNPILNTNNPINNHIITDMIPNQSINPNQSMIPNQSNHNLIRQTNIQSIINNNINSKMID